MFKRFHTWFSKQKLVSKLTIGCAGVLTLCCLCGIPVSLLGSPTPNTIPLSTSVGPLPTLPTTTKPTEPTDAPTLPPTATLASSPTALLIPSVTAEAINPALARPFSGNTLQFHFINVDQGDATLIQTQDGKSLLIDGGDPDTGIVQYLQSLGIQRIDLMIATHPHSDHIGGLVQVLQNFPVGKVITNGQIETTSVYEHFLDGIAKAGAEYSEVKRGNVITFDGIEFRVLNPSNLSNSDLNENSIVLQFTYGRTTFLMMGDSGAGTEAALLSAGLPLKADILKVGHHGSASGSTPAFLNAVQPEVALYSAGINNEYGLPAPQTIAALRDVSATVYGTDKDGTINIEVDQNGYTINSVLGGRGEDLALATATEAQASTSVLNGLKIVSVTSPVSRGANAALVAKTTPNARCTITVYYKSGPSSAVGLEPKTADDIGKVTWKWKVGSRTTPGTWRIVVTCNGITQETTHTVQ